MTCFNCTWFVNDDVDEPDDFQHDIAKKFNCGFCLLKDLFTSRLDKITYIIKDLDSKTLYVFFDNGTNITIINDKEVEDVVLQYWENR